MSSPPVIIWAQFVAVSSTFDPLSQSEPTEIRIAALKFSLPGPAYGCSAGPFVAPLFIERENDAYRWFEEGTPHSALAAGGL